MCVTARKRLDFVGDLVQFNRHWVLHQRHRLGTQRQLAALIAAPDENV